MKWNGLHYQKGKKSEENNIEFLAIRLSAGTPSGKRERNSGQNHCGSS